MSKFNSSRLWCSPSTILTANSPSCSLPFCLASWLHSRDAEEEESEEYFSPTGLAAPRTLLSLHFPAHKLVKSPTYMEMCHKHLLSKQNINRTSLPRWCPVKAPHKDNQDTPILVSSYCCDLPQFEIITWPCVWEKPLFENSLPTTTFQMWPKLQLAFIVNSASRSVM